MKIRLKILIYFLWCDACDDQEVTADKKVREEQQGKQWTCVKFENPVDQGTKKGHCGHPVVAAEEPSDLIVLQEKIGN